MSIFQALVLGIIQGLTEFIPISSSGHLIILPNLLGWQTQPLVFDTTLHLGTSLALIAYFWHDLLGILTSNKKLGYFILLGTIPAVVLGVAFEELIETTFRGMFFVGAFLLLGTIVMIIAEQFGRRNESREVGPKEGFIIGLFQALALLPGFSRSGATISGGMLLGLSREKAARFSFLLAIPVIVGAGIFKGIDSWGALGTVSWDALATGFVTSFVVGFLAIQFMLQFLKKRGLGVFIIYRILLILGLVLYSY